MRFMSALSAGLDTQPTIPEARHCSNTSPVVSAVSATTFGGLDRAVMSADASKPSMRGMCRSITTKSYGTLAASAFSTISAASRPSRATSHACTPSERRILRSTLTFTRSSSATSRRDALKSCSATLPGVPSDGGRPTLGNESIAEESASKLTGDETDGVSKGNTSLGSALGEAPSGRISKSDAHDPPLACDVAHLCAAMAASSTSSQSAA
mmetsp:Transcript_22051/g.68204  ORF Transcript_22051/g.68204 Transcript_22051/m.68204 type:complete len:211 (-) Transcript_22051:2093-2725(-)